MSSKIQINCNEDNRLRTHIIKESWKGLSSCYKELERRQEIIKKLDEGDFERNTEKYVHPSILEKLPTQKELKLLKLRHYENNYGIIKSLKDDIKIQSVWNKTMSTELSSFTC